MGTTDLSTIRVGIPKTLNVWSTHRFWIGFLTALGIRSENIVFSSDTSEEQSRQFGRGRGTVDCCHPVKSMSGHYGELLFGQKNRIDVLLSPMIYSLPSVLGQDVDDTLSCPRVMAAPENIKAGFLREADIFAANDVRYVSPFVSLADPEILPEQLYQSLKGVIGSSYQETAHAVAAGLDALEAFNASVRGRGREILTWCAEEDRPAILVLARPYHMDPGIGHEIEGALQARGYPILWVQYLPIDDDLMHWLFGPEVAEGRIRNAFDISDVWSSSYSSNTNEILWGAKVAARCPWITCVVRLASYECGMDQPTYTPTQKIVEATGTLFFKFGDLDATRPTGGIDIRIETIAHYMERESSRIIQRKKAWLPGPCPLVGVRNRS